MDLAQALSRIAMLEAANRDLRAALQPQFDWAFLALTKQQGQILALLYSRAGVGSEVAR